MHWCCDWSNIRSSASLSRTGTAEQYTHIVITMFAGRSLPAKRALYQAIVRSLEPFGVPPGDVRIILQEVARENVGMRGGKAAVDLELGYEVRV
jgi:phenylpyruvate tautomerase PptA (4-oxalocrotonate tautomerase family)